MKSKISIIIPTYNNGNFIERCLDSLLNQTYTNLEIIVVNDGSKDETDRIIKEKYLNLSNIKYFNNENYGVSYSRNFGMTHSSGEYVMFIDGDDWIESEYIENCYSFLLQNELDIVRTGYKIYDENGYRKMCRFNESINLLSKDDLQETLLYTTFFNSSCMQLIKKSVIKNIQFRDDLICGEDLLFSLKIMNNTSKIGYLSNHYYCYYANNESVTKTKNPTISLEKCRNIITVINYFYKYDFSKKKVAAKMYYEIEHYLRRFIQESNYSNHYYKKIITEILESQELLQSKKIYNLEYDKKLFSLKRWILVVLMLKSKPMYLMLLKIDKALKKE